VTETGCVWCGRLFGARRGGSRQIFCCSRHRHAFHSAARRWAERAVAAGTLTVDHIRINDPAACTLLLGGISSVPVPGPQGAAPVALGDSAEEAAELLDDFLIALLVDLPDIWDDLAAALPDEIYDRIDRYLEGRLSEDRV
jgi:hypothetical protein